MTNKLTTGERIMRLETKLDAHLEQDKLDHTEIMTKLDMLQDSFAGKWVEKIVIGLAITSLTVIITLITYLI